MEAQLIESACTINSLQNQVKELTKKLSISTTLLNERDNLYQDRINSIMLEKATLDGDNRELRDKMIEMERKEIIQKERKRAFRKDIEELEKAAKLLTQKEDDLEIKSNELDRVINNYKRKIEEAEFNYNKKKNENLEILREYDSYKETSNKRYEHLRLELENSVSKTEYDTLKTENKKLLQRINSDMVSIESVSKLNNTIESLERKIKQDYVPLKEYEAIIHDKSLLEETIKVIEENLGSKNNDYSNEMETYKRSLEMRLNQSDKELRTSRALIDELNEANNRNIKEIEQYEIRIHALTANVCELETCKAALLTQLGQLKGMYSKKSEGTTTLTYMNKKNVAKSELLQNENMDLNQELDVKTAMLENAQERTRQLQSRLAQLQMENLSHSTAAARAGEENKILAKGLVDLTNRTRDINMYVASKADNTSDGGSINNIGYGYYSSSIGGGRVGGSSSAVNVINSQYNKSKSHYHSGVGTNDRENLNANDDSRSILSLNTMSSVHSLDLKSHNHTVEAEAEANNNYNGNDINAGGIDADVAVDLPKIKNGGNYDLNQHISSSSSSSSSLLQHPMEAAAVSAIARRYVSQAQQPLEAELINVRGSNTDINVNANMNANELPPPLRSLDLDSLRSSTNSMPPQYPTNYTNTNTNANSNDNNSTKATNSTSE